MKKLYLLIFFFAFSTCLLAQTTNGQETSPKKSSQSFEIEGFEMYPNPITDGFLFISSLENQRKEVEIYDILGKRVFSRQLLQGKSRLDISVLRSGVYIIRVRENNKTTTRKLVVK